MNTISNLNPQRVAFMGDWHGNLNYARKQVFSAKMRNAPVIVHVGDFGYNFGDVFMDGLQSSLAAAGMHLVFVDGNHENFKTLYGYDLAPDGSRPMRKNITHLPRGFRWEWNGLSFLAMGGAHSVDRPWRTLDKSYWLEEHITYDEADAASQAGKADVMITHDCPAGFKIPGIDDRPEGDFGGWPPNEIRASFHNREVLQSVVDAVQPVRLVCGHYHLRKTGVLEGDGYNTIVDMLDCDGKPFLDNMMILDIT